MKTIFVDSQDMKQAQNTVAQIAGMLLSGYVRALGTGSVMDETREQAIDSAVAIFESVGKHVCKETQEHKDFVQRKSAA